MFQHIAKFVHGTTIPLTTEGHARCPAHSYGRHSLGLRFVASLALTTPLNLPALGRRQPPYVVFTTLRRPVFLVNSRLGHFSATIPEDGTPFPEVTGLVCRVPEREFSQAP